MYGDVKGNCRVIIHWQIIFFQNFAGVKDITRLFGGEETLTDLHYDQLYSKVRKSNEKCPLEFPARQRSAIGLRVCPVCPEHIISVTAGLVKTKVDKEAEAPLESATLCALERPRYQHQPLPYNGTLGLVE